MPFNNCRIKNCIKLILVLVIGLRLNAEAQFYKHLWVSGGYGHSFNVFKLDLQKEREWLPVKSILVGWQNELNKKTSLQIGIGINQIGYSVLYDIKDNIRLSSPRAYYRFNQLVIPMLALFTPTRVSRWQIQTGILHGIYRSSITSAPILEGDVFATHGYHYSVALMLRNAYCFATIKKTEISVFVGASPVLVGAFFDPVLLCSVEAGIFWRFKQTGE